MAEDIDSESRHQEEFWRGPFGADYANRSSDPDFVSSNVALFAEVLSRASELPDTVFELGANIGLNYLALKALLPHLKFTGLEVNRIAADKLAGLGCESVNESIHDFETSATYDLVLSKGVLIHINPNLLGEVYEKLFRFSRRYILLIEYYNPTPVEINYRGHPERLFKRDFAGEMMDRFPGLKLIGCGFAYHRSNFPQDDETWFLLEKT